jgi:hypothetical protein
VKIQGKFYVSGKVNVKLLQRWIRQHATKKQLHYQTDYVFQLFNYSSNVVWRFIAVHAQSPHCETEWSASRFGRLIPGKTPLVSSGQGPRSRCTHCVEEKYLCPCWESNRGRQPAARHWSNPAISPHIHTHMHKYYQRQYAIIFPNPVCFAYRRGMTLISVSHSPYLLVAASTPLLITLKALSTM